MLIKKNVLFGINDEAFVKTNNKWLFGTEGGLYVFFWPLFVSLFFFLLLHCTVYSDLTIMETFILADNVTRK